MRLHYTPLSLLPLLSLASAQQPTTSDPPTPTGTATLEPSWSWIRAVETPYYHSYLQSQPTQTPGAAHLAKNTNAGQFNVIDGQLVYNTGADKKPLYMNVEHRADEQQRKLQTWFNATKNEYGAFAFQGDALTWEADDFERPNTAAWYVCQEDKVFVNTGAYLDKTPEGCSDQTVSSPVFSLYLFVMLLLLLCVGC